jgi:photosystem II stability/assembly factor-like uncharacterized protein
MIKKLFSIIFFSAATLILSGCSLGSVVPAQNTMANATVIKSSDGGATWEPKSKIDGQKTIPSADVLSIAISPGDSNIVYIGTNSDGLYMTKDGAETWIQVPFASKAYGLAFDPQNSDVIYGSGIFNKRAKIYKRLQEGEEWKEIYTEPADGTTISALAIDKINSQTIYAGTSAGVILKTIDGGQSWASLKKADGPIISIAFDSADDRHIYFGVFQVGVLETKDSGKTINDVTKKFSNIGSSLGVYTIVADPSLAGIAYAGTGSGIFKRAADGTWNTMNIIESSKSFPIRSIVINPNNSKEIIYSSSKAIYKSMDSGLTWSTFQLETSKDISVMRYDSANISKIYAGLRSF